MANGHHLPDPWDEALALRKAMSRTAHLFDCLWRSEPDPERFENLREWVSVVHADAKTKLTAIELFVKLQQRKRQRSNGSKSPQIKPCNPALSTMVDPKTPVDHASITDETGVLKGQAMLDFHAANVENVPHGFDTACGMGPNMTSGPASEVNDWRLRLLSIEI